MRTKSGNWVALLTALTVLAGCAPIEETRTRSTLPLRERLLGREPIDDGQFRVSAVRHAQVIDVEVEPAARCRTTTVRESEVSETIARQPSTAVIVAELGIALTGAALFGVGYREHEREKENDEDDYHVGSAWETVMFVGGTVFVISAVAAGVDMGAAEVKTTKQVQTTPIESDEPCPRSMLKGQAARLTTTGLTLSGVLDARGNARIELPASFPEGPVSLDVLLGPRFIGVVQIGASR